MEFIEFRGFKNIFIGLAKYNDEQYCLVYGKIGTAKINHSEENVDILGAHNEKILNFCRNKQLTIDIPFIPTRHGALTNIQLISDKNEYYTVLSVLETLL